LSVKVRRARKQARRKRCCYQCVLCCLIHLVSSVVVRAGTHAIDVPFYTALPPRSSASSAELLGCSSAGAGGVPAWKNAPAGFLRARRQRSPDKIINRLNRASEGSCSMLSRLGGAAGGARYPSRSVMPRAAHPFATLSWPLCGHGVLVWRLAGPRGFSSAQQVCKRDPQLAPLRRGFFVR
jgi:hypothetical protein